MIKIDFFYVFCYNTLSIKENFMRFNTDGFNPSDEQNQDTQPKRVAVSVNISDFTNALQAFEAKISAMREEFKVLFKERVDMLFGAVPDLEAIEIIQYTPYFMDGDVCEFSISSVSFYDEDDYDQDWDYDFDSPVEQQLLKDALLRFIRSNDELMKSMYGDHAKITITREGTEVEEYDHE